MKVTDVIPDVGDYPQNQSDQKNDQAVDDGVEVLHASRIARLGLWRGS